MKLGQGFYSEMNEYSLSYLFSCSLQLKLHSKNISYCIICDRLLEIIYPT